jgi:hypothetical protein
VTQAEYRNGEMMADCARRVCPAPTVLVE